MKKRVLSLLLAVVMLWSLLPTAVFAADGELSGSGTEDDPYRIANAADLLAFATKVNDGSETTACAVLTENIDLTGEPWTPIGSGTSYEGTFDGCRFTVSGLSITADGSWETYTVGFFGCVGGAAIKNLKVEGTITVTADCEACPYVGGIAAYVSSDSSFENCKSAVNITVNSSINGNGVGGIVGMVESEDASFARCTNWGDISLDGSDSMGCGGIVGYSSSAIKMNYCYNYANIECHDDDTFLGGLFGYCDDATILTGCYSAASAEPRKEPDGLIGKQLSGNSVGDLFGISSNFQLSRTLVFCDQFGSYKNLGEYYGVLDYDYSNIRNADSDYMSASDMVTYLNGDDGNIYLIPDTGYGGGWPILAWELQEPDKPIDPGNPVEKYWRDAKSAFESQQAAALNTLKNGYADFERKLSQYSEENQAALSEIYKKAEKELKGLSFKALKDFGDSPTEQDIADYVATLPSPSSLAEAALQEMDTVPTKQKEEAFEKQKEDALKSFWGAGYNPSLYYAGYREQLLTLHGKSAAVWHDLNADAEAAITEAFAALSATFQEGQNALTACTNKAALDKTLADYEAKLQVVVKNAQAALQFADNGVKAAAKWDGTSAKQPSGSGTANSPYRIGTAAELSWFAQQVKSGKRSACAVLTADIDLNGKPWTPIANNGLNSGYTGTFDGKNHIIHGLYLTASDANQRLGLFGTVDRSGVVKNLNAAGTALISTNAGTGLIAGVSSGTIYNCGASVFLRADENAPTTINSAACAGGIVGKVSEGYVENCRTWGLFAAFERCAVLSRLGGVVGVLDCYAENAGGMVRYCRNNIALESCKLDTYKIGETAVTGSAIGGIVGSVSTIGKVRECVNNAPVTGESNIGGIVGAASPNEGGIISIAYVENNGAVTGGSTPNRAGGTGGIIGRAGSTVSPGGTSQPVGDFSLEHAYNTGKVTSPGSCGGIIGEWINGAASHAQSQTGCAAHLWGTAVMASITSADTAVVDALTSPVRADGGTPEKLSASQELMSELIRFDPKDKKYTAYGDQSPLYNAAVMQCVRDVETSSDAAAALEAGRKTLAAVPTQLDAERSKLLADMQSYAAAHIYDTAGQESVTALLTEAETAIASASSVKAVNDLRQSYLGTENIDGKLPQITPYPVKAANELYNKYIVDKNYSQADAARVLRAYEGWRAKLNGAADLDAVEAVYADARKAMDALTKELPQGESAPDLTAAAADALTLARQEVLDELSALKDDCLAKLNRQVEAAGDLSGDWRSRLSAVLTAADRELQAAATPQLVNVTDYALLNELLSAGKAQLDASFRSASDQLTAMLLSAANKDAWDGTSAKQPSGSGTETDPYKIGTAAELSWLRDTVNANTDSTYSHHAVLTADIDLGYRPWTPIGTNKDNAYQGGFRCTLDGNGHTISGLSVTEPIKGRIGSTSTPCGYAGLFGYTSSAVIKDLTVDGEIALTGATTVYAGGIAGSFHGTMKNCVSRVHISVALTGSYRNSSAVGGLVGKLRGTALTGCRFEGAAQVNSGAGTNYLEGGLGGIAGVCDSSAALTRCVNTGAVTADKATGVGGILGRTDGGTITLTECSNSGHISNDTAAVLGIGEKPKGGTGGILGVGKSGNVSISLCYNTGTVSGTTIVGGILGGEAGDYGTSISNGNPSLTVENCYNAGLLDVGSRTNRIGSLVGFPIAGQYRDGLYVLGSSSRQAKGWFSSQGECITVLDTLTAAAINRTGDMVDSIARLNSGCPLFMWQLEETASRSAVIAYLRSYYTDNVHTAATPAQRDALETQLTETEAAINAPSSKAPAIVEAYETMLSAMNADTLVQAAKDEAKAELNRLKEDSAKTYPAIKDKLKALLDDRLAALDKCKTGAEVQSCVDAFAAGVVDLLIDDAAGARLKELETKLKTIESAYNALDKTRQSLVTKYGKLAGMQQLYKQYTENLEALKKWYDEDCKRYDYIKKTVEKLYNGAVTQLGECTDKAAMDAVMNGYVVDIAEALTGDIAYKPGKTPASALKNLETRIKNARTAYNSLTAEQKQLFDKDLLASLQGAESLLSAYNSGISSLSSRLQQDKKAYPDLSDKLERLASRARNAMDSSVDTSGILSTLDRYAASVVDALIDDIGYVPDVMSESDAAVLRGKISRAQSAYNALTAAQKKLVKGVTALETAAARMAAYEENYKAAQRVVELIKAIGTVTKDSYDAIKRATDAYNALTPVQKALVPQWAIDLLEEATAKYKELTAADDTASAEQPAELPLDDLRTEEAAKPDRPFDWTIVWMGAGILAALGIIVLLWKWFSATKQTRRRNDE